MAVTTPDEQIERAEPNGRERASHPRINVRLLLTLLLAGLLLWLLVTYGRLLTEVIMVVFAAFLVNLAIRPLADRLYGYRIPRGVTVLAVYAVVVGLLYLLVRFTLPSIVGEVSRFQGEDGDTVAVVVERLGGLPPLAGLNISIERVVETVVTQAEAVPGAVATALTGVTRVVIDALLVFVLAYFFVTDRKIGTGLLFTWVPRHRRLRVRTVVGNASRRLSRWIVAQMLLAAVFGVVFGTGLAIMRIPFAMSIAVVGSVLEFVPFLGGAVSLILSVVVALTFRPGMTVWVVVLYAAVQQLQVHVLQPVLYGRAVEVHPAIILIALLVGAQLGGIIGALFAVPVAVVLMTVFDEIEKPGDAPPPPDEQPLPASRLPG